MTNHVPPTSEPVHTTGPLAFLHPTIRYHPLVPRSQQPQEQEQASQRGQQPQDYADVTAAPSTTAAAAEPDSQIQPQTQTQGQHQHQHAIYHVWRSRDNRKGRHRAVVFLPPPSSKSPGASKEGTGTGSGITDGKTTGVEVKHEDGGVDVSVKKAQQMGYERKWQLWVRQTGEGLMTMVTMFPVWD
ncbi:uncharacterized protein C8A04DRAFT_28151, partial [Dichotomopilus funicola]